MIKERILDIHKIISNFYKTSDFSKNSEVDLFKNLARAIVTSSNSVFIDETHGATKCNVEFDLTSGDSTRCEIADLLIIVKMKNTPYLRATFWQAKKEKSPKWISKPTLDSHLDFRGQFNQWDLLSRRPQIRGVSPFNPPSDLLATFNSSSIGSFGVFYEKSAKIEVMHSVAEFVSCCNPLTKHPTMVANGRLEKYFYAESEVLVRPTLQGFLEALFSHQIGALIKTTKNSHKWLLSYAASKVGPTDNIDLDLFFGDLEPFNSETDTGKGDGLSMLLINNDEIS